MVVGTLYGHVQASQRCHSLAAGVGRILVAGLALLHVGLDETHQTAFLLDFRSRVYESPADDDEAGEWRDCTQHIPHPLVFMPSPCTGH